MKPTIAITGASGFIGRWFIEQYHQKYNIIALSRSQIAKDQRANVEWRQADLYSLSSTTEALRGADYALYLVHSMSPSTRLNQGEFQDTDLLLADNFARAAEHCNLKQIIYLGGILPKDKSKLSVHLRSRYEVELTLGARSTRLTALRAGIIIGSGGSSFQIVEKLTKRLPVMVCPEWTKSKSQPIDVAAMLVVIDQTLGNEKTYNSAIEVGGREIVTYMTLLKMTAAAMDKRRIIFSIPFFTVGFSKLWVGLFSDSSPTLVSPLIESLKHDMTVDPETATEVDIPDISLKDSISKALHQKAPVKPESTPSVKTKNTVRSVQRLPNPSRKSAVWIAEQYPIWLTRTFKFIIRAVKEGDYVLFTLFGVTLLKLKFIHDRSDKERQLFYIVGGKLVKRTDHGWLEFRSVLDNRYNIAAIHEFVPRLPWLIYKNIQAKAHLWVMNRYGDYLSQLHKEKEF